MDEIWSWYYLIRHPKIKKIDRIIYSKISEICLRKLLFVCYCIFMDKIIGFILLAAYILMVGLGTFLQKFVMGKVTPFQLEFMTAISMLLVTVPALLIS